MVGNGPNNHDYLRRTNRSDRDNLSEQAPFVFAHGLCNLANLVSHHNRWLFANFEPVDSTLSQCVQPAHHFINMVSLLTLPENNTVSMHSSTGTVPTEVLHPEDEDYDMDLPPYPRASLASQFFLPKREI